MLGLKPADVGLFVIPADPRLSPDGSRVAFSVQRVDMENNRYPARVWIAATDGAFARRRDLVRNGDDGPPALVARRRHHRVHGARPLDDDDAV